MMLITNKLKTLLYNLYTTDVPWLSHRTFFPSPDDIFVRYLGFTYLLSLSLAYYKLRRFGTYLKNGNLRSIISNSNSLNEDMVNMNFIQTSKILYETIHQVHQILEDTLSLINGKEGKKKTTDQINTNTTQHNTQTTYEKKNHNFNSILN